MNVFEEMARQIAINAINKNPPEDGDYIGEGGLLYCGKCHTPRQIEREFCGEITKLPIVCECRQKAMKEKARLKEQAQIQDRIAELRKRSLMDERFADCTFDQVEETAENAKVLSFAKRYVERFDEMLEKNQGLLFYGNVGTGKTMIASCIGNELITRLHPVFASSLVKILSATNGWKTEDDEEEFIRKMNRAELMILDDLGAERSTDYALEKVYHVIDSRYRVGKPLIVTTNMTVKEMKESTDIRYQRIYDRVFELCFPVRFDWASFRKKQAASRFYDMQKMMEEE